LNQNGTGNSNTSSGWQALFSNTTGNNNTASGINALSGNTTGGNNIGLGSAAGVNLTTGNNNIDIGNAGVAAESNTIRIGTSGTEIATFIAGIRGVGVAGGQPVAVSASGQLGVRASSARFKENIRPMDKASEAILSLQPVTFRYRKELDPKGAAQFGLVAEEVAKTSPDLVVCDDQGNPFTVRYEEVNAMLLNEFLKEHRKVESLEASVAQQGRDIQVAQVLRATVAKQQEQIGALIAALKAQSAEIAQVRAQIKSNEPSPSLVAANR
jgi:hypothetical protein